MAQAPPRRAPGLASGASPPRGGCRGVGARTEEGAPRRRSTPRGRASRGAGARTEEGRTGLACVRAAELLRHEDSHFYELLRHEDSHFYELPK